MRLFSALQDSAARSAACAAWLADPDGKDVPAALAHVGAIYQEWRGAAMNVCPRERPAGWNTERWLARQLRDMQKHEAVYQRLAAGE